MLWESITNKGWRISDYNHTIHSEGEASTRYYIVLFCSDPEEAPLSIGISQCIIEDRKINWNFVVENVSETGRQGCTL